MRVKVSAASARQMFRPCSADFIRTTCHAACCRSTTDPTGIAVYVSPAEAPRLRMLGATVGPDGRVAPVARRCPFQDPVTHLCTIHATDEPFGCIASPFTFNANRTLIVRNRYRMLKCYRAPGAEPVYRAHRRALDRIFGAGEAARIVAHLDAGGGDLLASAPADVVAYLTAKNQASKPHR